MSSNGPIPLSLRPGCCSIDKPAASRNAIFENNAYFTHDGAEIIYENLAHEIDRYAKEYGEVADGLWRNHYEGKGPGNPKRPSVRGSIPPPERNINP